MSAISLIPFLFNGVSPTGQKELMKYYLLSIENENN